MASMGVGGLPIWFQRICLAAAKNYEINTRLAQEDCIRHGALVSFIFYDICTMASGHSTHNFYLQGLLHYVVVVLESYPCMWCGRINQNIA